jgi:hypothetical protein
MSVDYVPLSEETDADEDGGAWVKSTDDRRLRRGEYA